MPRIALAVLVSLSLAACGATAVEGSPDRGESSASDADADANEESCQAVGGTCVGVGQCGERAGHLADVACPGFPVVCCLPLSACTGPEPTCCAAGFTLRPSCQAGRYVCDSGAFCDAGD